MSSHVFFEMVGSMEGTVWTDRTGVGATQVTSENSRGNGGHDEMITSSIAYKRVNNFPLLLAKLIIGIQSQ